MSTPSAAFARVPGSCYHSGLGGVGPLPLYEYQCARCGRFEVIRKFSDAPLSACPTCGEEIHKLLSAPAIQFKGTGWYVTDYARKSGSDAKSGDSGSGSKESSSKESSSKECAPRRTPALLRPPHQKTALRRAAAPRSNSSSRRNLSLPKIPRAARSGGPTFLAERRRSRTSSGSSDRRARRRQLELQRLQVLAERRRPGLRASARTPPSPSGSRACCRRRGARPRSGSRRAGRLSVEGADAVGELDLAARVARRRSRAPRRCPGSGCSGR